MQRSLWESSLMLKYEGTIWRSGGSLPEPRLTTIVLEQDQKLRELGLAVKYVQVTVIGNTIHRLSLSQALVSLALISRVAE